MAATGMTAATQRARRRRLVYTSAGPQQVIDRWLRGRKTFDVWVTAYDPRARVIEPHVERYVERAGSKFENLYALYETDPNAFASYDSVLVLDDDLRLTGKKLERLFDMQDEHGFAISMPSFLPSGKISHPVTRCQPGNLYRHTDFVEVNAPLVRRELLVDFLQAYRGQLLDFGVDHWLVHHAGPENERRIVVIDDVPCVNPTDAVKRGEGNVDSMRPRSARAEEWASFAAEHGIPERRGITIKHVRNRPTRAALNRVRCAASVLRRMLQQRR